MPDSNLPSPHNRFFHYSFSNLDVARDLLSSKLAPEILDCIDLETLEIGSGSFVDDQLRESQSDLLFSVAPKKALLETLAAGAGKRATRILIYVLLEHKSHPDRMTPFQLLKYIVRVWEQLLREGKPLACVVPLIIYHGETDWTVARSLGDLFNVPDELRRHMPQFEPLFLDFSQQSSEEKFDNPFLQAVVQTLRYVWGDRIRQKLPELVELFREITHDGRDAAPLKAFLVYIISAAPKLDQRELTEAIKNSFPSLGPALMSTIAEQYFLQGKEKGKEEGMEKGMEEGIEKGELLGAIRTIRSILKITELGEKELRSMSIAALQTMADELTSRLQTRLGN